MFDFVEKNILELNEALENNELTSYELTLQLLERIGEIDNGETKYNSVLEVNPDALNIARQLDIERANGHVRSKIHGIPILLKDNIDTFDKMHCTAGSIALKEHFPKQDAVIVQNLREHGAIILGKTNLTEYANFVSYNMRNGYSSLGGEVLCPWNLEHDPLGSSAGSAVAVTLNLAPIAVGTETSGSVISPSIRNGVVGMKPTIGLISRTGIIPISSTLDTAGPMGKTVTDVAILLSTLRSNDPSDPVTLGKSSKYIDYTKFLDKHALKGARIGINYDGFDKVEGVKKQAFLNLLDTIKVHGGVLVDDIKFEQPNNIFNIMKHEFKRTINHYLSNTRVQVQIKNLKDLVEFKNADLENRSKYGHKLLEDCQKVSGRMIDTEYVEALREREHAAKTLHKIFDENHLDIMLFASFPVVGPYSGFPTMTIPIGVDEENIPIGTFFLAKHYEEDKLISILYSLEQVTKKRHNPIKK